MRALAQYLVHAEEGLVLRHHGVTGFSQDADERVLIQAVERHHHGQAAHKLGYHAELYKVTCLHVLQEPVLLLDLSHSVHLSTSHVGHVSCSCCPSTFTKAGWCSKAQVLTTRAQTTTSS